MKQLKYLFILIIGLIILSPGVKAESYSLNYKDYYLDPGSNLYVINSYEFLYSKFPDETIDIYNQAMNYYNLNYKESYPYYYISWFANFNSEEFTIDNIYNSLSLILYFSSEIPTCTTDNLFRCTFDGTVTVNYSGTDYTTFGSTLSHYLIPGIELRPYYNLYYYSTLNYFTSNFDIFIPSFDEDTYNFTINDQNYSLSSGDKLPMFYTSALLKDNYTTINLDDYHYVLLSLKDYNQTEAFNTNLQVKGMIGITPIYNFGTAEKTTITDRCNISYSDYTDYRLYVLKDDLINNAIYAVKSCEDGSSFKFDNSIFNITYVTDDNVDDPVVVVDGQEYHTIPFNQLSNSANQNEQNNFIPGQSEETSFSDIIESVTKDLESVWNVITTFMGLVTKFFNTLPKEIRIISLTTFTTMCTLGIIKFLKG